MGSWSFRKPMDTFPMHLIGLGVAWRLCFDEFVANFGGTGADLAL
jgi:hypothetical protein